VRSLRLWVPPAALAAAIAVLSSLSTVPGAEHVWDKVAHAAAFGSLAALSLRAAHGGWGPLRLAPTALASAACLAWGLLDELHQSLVPGRSPSAADVVADAVGIACAIALWSAASMRPRESADTGEKR
jgi:VanZ family protein